MRYASILLETFFFQIITVTGEYQNFIDINLEFPEITFSLPEYNQRS